MIINVVLLRGSGGFSFPDDSRTMWGGPVGRKPIAFLSKAKAGSIILSDVTSITIFLKRTKIIRFVLNDRYVNWQRVKFNFSENDCANSLFYIFAKRTKQLLLAMKNIIKIVCTLILFLCGAGVVYSKTTASPSVSLIKHLGYADGLSSQRVYAIAEDKCNAIWISTKAGIDRYNGHKIKAYQLPGDFYYGDLAARIIRIDCLPDSSLWAYDNTGKIYCYSEIHDSFELVRRLSDDISGNITLNKFCKSENGHFFFGLTQGLYRASENGKAQIYMPGINVNDIVPVGDSLYVGTTEGLKIIDVNTGRSILSQLEEKSIQTLYYDGDKKCLFIGTFNNGLWVKDLTSGKFTHIKDGGNRRSGINNPIRSIIKFDDDTLIVGVDGDGIFSFDYDDGTMRTLVDTEDRGDNVSLVSNGIYALLKDRFGNLWAGSYTGGVTAFTFSKALAQVYTHEKGNPNSIVNDNVNAIAENVDGDLWFATENGISILKNSDDKWRHLFHNEVCVSLCPGENGEMMVGTYGKGIEVLDRNGMLVKQLTKHSAGLTSNYIFSIRRDRDGDYWIGSIDGDLMCLDKNWKLKNTFGISLVFSIECIGGDSIAAATCDGFCIIDKTTGKVSRFATVQELAELNVSVYIVPMLFNGDNTVWLGTEGGGLFLYDMKEKKIVRQLTVKDGLPSNDIFGLLTDIDGRLWISTGNGIAVLDGSEIWNLNYIKGIEAEYNKSACMMSGSGSLLFGSSTGAVKIFPDEISEADYTAPLRLTKFTVDNQSDGNLQIAEKMFRMLSKEKDMRLKYNQNTFSINFESINFCYQDDIVYKYILENYDNGWSELSAEETARYKNVSPGDYVFRICNISKSTGKIISEASLPITVARPWWNSWWAWVTYAVLFGMLCYFIFRYKWYQLQQKYSEGKIKFFINAAHDIRTPITLVMGPLEDIRKEKNLPESVNYLLDLAHANIRRLHSITSQLLEFEKIDTHFRKERTISIDLGKMLEEEAECFQAACEKKGISLELSLPQEAVCVKATQRMLEIIFDNLISNACKYTQKGGRISIIVTGNEKKAVVRIEDTGIGIPRKGHKYILSDVYRAENARKSQETGMGFGLLQVKRMVRLLHGSVEFSSEEGVGTCFIVSFNRIYAEPQPTSRQSAFNNVWNEVLPYEVMSPAGEGGKKDETVLVVEDNDDLRHYLNMILSSDFNVVEMPSADDALTYMESEYPDLIISDVMMPGLQGDDFCRTLKENPDTAGIPVILLTAKTSHDAIVEGFQKGADDYLTKPFNTEILKLKVQGLLDNRKRLREYVLNQVVSRIGNKEQANMDDEADISKNELSDTDRLFVKKATDIVSDNIASTTFSIDTLCREMAMSRTLFYSRLKSLTGKAPQEFIRIIRLEKAADLLRQGQSVADVAEATGFINVKYFSTVFKRHFGIQPSKFTGE